MITGGVCFSYWLDFGFSFLDPETIAWRFPLGFQMFFALIILLFILELPESPRWLILKGQEDEALSVLSALSNLPSDDVSTMRVFARTRPADRTVALCVRRIYCYQRHSVGNVQRQFPRPFHNGRGPSSSPYITRVHESGLPADLWYQPHHLLRCNYLPEPNRTRWPDISRPCSSQWYWYALTHFILFPVVLVVDSQSS